MSDSTTAGGWPFVTVVMPIRNEGPYIERCLALREPTPIAGAGAVVAPSPLSIDPSLSLKVAREAWTRTFECRYLEALLERRDGNVTAAARAAQVDRIYFYRLLWRHGLR